MSVVPMPTNVAEVLAQYPDNVQARIRWLRSLIYDVAAETEGVGPLEETLKWGQISYLTPHTKSGTTIRIDALKDGSDRLGMFVHCQTTLVDTYRALYGDQFTYEGTRCLHVDPEPPLDALRHCIALALTYHQNKS